MAIGVEFSEFFKLISLATLASIFAGVSDIFQRVYMILISAIRLNSVLKNGLPNSLSRVSSMRMWGRTSIRLTSKT
jgi:hypothetical protein